MRVLLRKITDIEIMREMCLDPLGSLNQISAVDSDVQVVSGWLIEHIPEIKIAGELVWAKLAGFPWWPGVIIDDPKTECHFRNSDTCASAEPEYNVLFFDKHSMQRAWVSESNLMAYQTSDQKSLSKQQSSKYKIRFAVAIEWAAEVYDWSSSDRKKFFAAGFEGKI